jgi:predicted SprT family Zn-dependent metalloprotease
MNFAKRGTGKSTTICLFLMLGIVPSTPTVLAQNIPTPMPSESLIPSVTKQPTPLPSINSTPLPSVYEPDLPTGSWPSASVEPPYIFSTPIPSTIPSVMMNEPLISPSYFSSPIPYINSQEKKNKRNYVSFQEYLGSSKQKIDENAYWQKFPIPKISKKFTPKQRSKIWQALSIAQGRVQSEKVLDCIDKRVTTKEYDDETPREAVRRFINNAQLSLVADPAVLPEKNRRQYLYIENKPHAFHKRDKYNGWAILGYSRFIEKEDLTINLNPVKISKYDVDYWAGVIVHEIMHLHSYDHGEYDTKKDHYEQFKGNLTYETGWCVSSNGDEQKYKRVANVYTPYEMDLFDPSMDLEPSKLNEIPNPNQTPLIKPEILGGEKSGNKKAK